MFTLRTQYLKNSFLFSHNEVPHSAMGTEFFMIQQSTIIIDIEFLIGISQREKHSTLNECKVMEK